MPIPRLVPGDTALLVVDVQERLMPTIAGGDRVVRNAAVLLRAADLLEIPYLVTEQYPAGLGRTVDTVASAMADQSLRVEKTRFSALVDLVDERLRQWRRSSVIVCGVEAHVCVCQTVLDLAASGRQPFVCTDAVAASQPDQVAPALDRMSRAGAVTTGVLAAMYELLGDAAHPAFRTCLELARKTLG